jgi:CelD/BcsL family acetyltransferase involved in cellulose biosynthesis
MNLHDILKYAPQGDAEAAPRSFMPQSWGAPARIDFTEIGLFSDQDYAQWTSLSRASGGYNPFAEDWCMRAALQNLEIKGSVELAIAKTPSGQWLGVLPIARAENFGRLPVRNQYSWHVSNQFIGGPLILPGAEKLFWAALLAALDQHASRSPLLHLRQLAADDSHVQALYAICNEQRRPMHIVQWHDRAAFYPISGDMAYPAKSRKKAASRLRSLLRRLEEDMGSVIVETPADSASVVRWVDEFLQLESKGWKGKAGSALMTQKASAAFFKNMLIGAHQAGQLQARSLYAGDICLAMNAYFTNGMRGFGFKMAYDEAYAAYAPGQLLIHAICQEVEHSTVLLFDSCSSPNSSLNARWPQRRRIIDLAVSLGTRSRHIPFHLTFGSIGAWHGAKSLIARLR